MATAIAHRGPDAEGYWCGAGVGLAHRRLSIIDLSTGRQPLCNEDGSIQIVFNGEIYNYRDLMAQLKRRGHRFASQSDTEVIVHLYEDCDEELVQRLRGMFAFAIWDAPRDRLCIARDRVGLKPLYYYVDDEKLLFGSEIKAILAYGGIPREIDIQALEDYFTFGMVPGERTIFRGIRKLLPGHWLTLDRGAWRVTVRRYWQLELGEDEQRSSDEWQEALEEKIRETVAAHRIADVPVGAFLSGGLDSSAVVAMLSQPGQAPVRTFSVGFEEEAFSELPYARVVARRFATHHVEEVVTPEAVKSLDDLVHYYDEPFADPSAVASLCLARVAQRQVKVALSGDGGDEAFGGYRRYVHDLREARWRRAMPSWLRRCLVGPAARLWPKADWLPRPLRLKTTLTNLSLQLGAAYANTLSVCRPPCRRALLRPELRAALGDYRPEETVTRFFEGADHDPLRSMILADVGMLLPDAFLTKVDRASMAVGLEVRPPLVDHELLQLAVRVPSRFKIRNGETKWLFKQLCARCLPSDIVHRPKQGFDLPLDAWLRGPLRDVFESRVLSPSSPISTFIDQAQAARLYRSHLTRLGRHGLVLWTLLVLGSWSEHYLTRQPSQAC
jgi:asparagine synthase (glutamine-hydrolysing)